MGPFSNPGHTHPYIGVAPPPPRGLSWRGVLTVISCGLRNYIDQHHRGILGVTHFIAMNLITTSLIPVTHFLVIGPNVHYVGMSNYEYTEVAAMDFRANNPPLIIPICNCPQ